MITDEEAIRQRHSVRQYTDEPISEPPAWFARGIEFSLLAPTAVNQQKFHFDLLDDGADAEGVRVKATTGLGSYTDIDLGIAKLHFELGAGTGSIEWA